jgi:hypothetical protein
VKLSCGSPEGTAHAPVPVNRRTSVLGHVRDLRGRNRSTLVRAANGRHYIRKSLDSVGNADLLFNEAFGSQLAKWLGLSFPNWVELLNPDGDMIQSVGGTDFLSRRTSFGSELVPGGLVEYLPGARYSSVRNRAEAYSCLLFDLWCNHADNRQAVYQDCGFSSLHMYFFDNDQLFAADKDTPIHQRIAQTRYLDVRLYTQPFQPVRQVLRSLAAKIESLTTNKLEAIMAGIPRHWGTATHREEVISGLRCRSNLLEAYIDGITAFAGVQARGTRR